MLPTNFLYKPWSSLPTLLMLFFIAQHTQRHFWLGYFWSYTEIHRFYFLSFSSYLFLHCNIRTFSVEEKIHTACHTPQNQVWFTVHNKQCRQDHWTAFPHDAGKRGAAALLCSSPACHAWLVPGKCGASVFLFTPPGPRQPDTQISKGIMTPAA